MSHCLCRSLAVAVAALPLVAAAQNVDVGRREYMISCAQCHGIEGKGDGVIAIYLNTLPSDLTTIQRANRGIFPFAEIYATIEGGRITGPHGTREMPAWGDRYSVEAAEALGFHYAPSEQLAFVHGRILALIEYIASLQEP